MKTLSYSKTRRAGFSLAELMVVIVIIGLLATMVVPNVIARFATSQRGIARAELATIHEGINTFAIQNNGQYPEDIEALITPDELGHKLIEKKSLNDPWGNPYQYQPPPPGSPADEMELFSMAKDGVPGGEGEGKDIHWNDEEEE